MIVAHRKSSAPRKSHQAAQQPAGSSSSSDNTNYKVQYYAEFLKRLIYQSKYLSLCKLCGEFLDELLDALTPLRIEYIKSDILKFQFFDNTFEQGEVSRSFAHNFLFKIRQRKALCKSVFQTLLSDFAKCIPDNGFESEPFEREEKSFLDRFFVGAEGVKIISNKQKLLLNGTIDAASKLAPIVEEVDDEQVDHTVMGVATKVLKIQQKLEEVEANDELILEKCNTKLKQSNAYLIKISNENEKLRAMTKDINPFLWQNFSVKERMNNLQAERDGEALKSARSREEFHDLVERFESMQQHFVDLEDNLKNITVAQDEHYELEKLKKLLEESNHRNIEMDTQLSRTERMLKDKGFLVDSLTKQLLDLESKNMTLAKEREAERKQKNTVEGQLKALKESLETIEKDKLLFSGLVQEKEMYIARLEDENREMECELMSERSMTARDFEDLNGSMKGLNRTVKLTLSLGTASY